MAEEKLAMPVRGDLHLIERLDNVKKRKDGTWWSGYWELTDAERPLVRRVFLHRTKAERSHFGGEVVRIFSASEDPELDAQRQPELADRWVLVVLPEKAAKDVAWEGPDHQLAYKSLV